jgi:hypothetical protein
VRPWLLGLVSLVPFLASAEPPKSSLQPFQFRDWRVGDPHIISDPRLAQCVKIEKGVACKLSDNKIAGGDVIQIGVAFSARGLFAVEARFDAERADQVEAVLLKRYGQPCISEAKSAMNALGMTFPVRIRTWCFSDGKAFFRSIGKKRSEADFEFASTDASIIDASGNLPKPDF